MKMKILAILLLTSLSVAASDGFRYSVSSDLVWPQSKGPKLKETIGLVFNEADFDESIESTVVVTILIKKDGKIEKVIPASADVNPIVLEELVKRIETWSFQPSDVQAAVVMKFEIKIET